MKQTKNQIRQQLAQGLSVFLSEGKQITKVPTRGHKIPKPHREEVIEVEIEVEHLPIALQQKYFNEA